MEEEAPSFLEEDLILKCARCSLSLPHYQFPRKLSLQHSKTCSACSTKLMENADNRVKKKGLEANKENIGSSDTDICVGIRSINHKKLPASVTLGQFLRLLENNRDCGFEFDAFVELPIHPNPALSISDRAKEMNLKIQQALKYKFK